MSTITAVLQCFETTSRVKRELLFASLAIDDVALLGVQKVQLARGEDLVVPIKRILICSVNTPILIQIEVDGNVIEAPITSTLVLPFETNVTFLNPLSNSITLPAVLNYIAI